MVKCLNIRKNIGKPIYRSISNQVKMSESATQKVSLLDFVHSLSNCNFLPRLKKTEAACSFSCCS